MHTLPTGNIILLPTRGMQPTYAGSAVEDFLGELNMKTNVTQPMRLRARVSGVQKKNIEMTVLDSMHENGGKLVKIDTGNLAELRLSYPGMQIIPEVMYQTAKAPRPEILRTTKAIAAGHKVDIVVTDVGGTGIMGAEVVAFSDYENGVGKSGFTNAKGVWRMTLGAGTKIEQLYVYPPHSYWPIRVKRPRLREDSLRVVTPFVDPGYEDLLKFFYRPGKLKDIAGNVVVGVVDTGVGPHREVPVAGGLNLVRNESPLDYQDVDGHGTHVAGIIGAIGNATDSIRGVAAGVALRSYRIFSATDPDASNFSIMKAIDKAVEDNCDLINLSIGGVAEDQGVSIAIAEAYEKGTVCFGATGNENRKGVCFPAAAQLCIAVSAFGRKSLWEKDATQNENVKAPYGKPDRRNFLADFSNIGPEVDMTAPGVGIVSTFKGDLYAVMDGTSMACPAATGAAARLLSEAPAIVAMDRNVNRANEMVKLFSTHVKPLGFGAKYEGKGVMSLGKKV